MPPRRGRVRGHIEQLPSGSYRVIVYAGTDPLTGKPRRLRETWPTYAEAEKGMTQLQRQVDEDQHPKSNITLPQAIEQWLDVAALEDTTRERYDDLIRLYILPTFGDLPAAKLDAELLERFYARLHRRRESVHRQGAWARLAAAQLQHDAEGALHHPRRPGTRRAGGATSV